ncbi:protein of unknown function [Proteiniborus ethanoligenes]|uniref:DUF1858 domain-containing protein n=1 Tax=Proteiniborus ethanoligenes TaxID=415015 RepID=A0A1H3MZ62_9FIRM|nr:DUF1858 domain-containing protein [Proteiniborus ethanoligenes]TAH63995.1 MAG: DUF1858 domain-containing protein [Gottschalkiaceae bacterium]SDY81896.1 protein of unknown function [Proteiniborus ethanoligenes]
MNKVISLNETIYELCNKYPEIKEILRDLGFVDIVNPIMMNTAGRVMTIPKGTQMKNIHIEKVIEKLKENSFEIIQ